MSSAPFSNRLVTPAEEDLMSNAFDGLLARLDIDDEEDETLLATTIISLIASGTPAQCLLAQAEQEFLIAKQEMAAGAKIARMSRG